uniref:Cyclin J like n=1 Tax=Cairina moschata TaxID=8855 RepID=A0A8C3BLE0_CAIMO
MFVREELNLPLYKAHSPQIGRRRYFIDLLTILSNCCGLCPTARHLAAYLLDLFMDHYSISVKQLYISAFACLLLASKLIFLALFSPHCKFEEKENKVPKLEHLNNLAYMCNVNVILSQKNLLRMEMLLLENFSWNLCLPTPPHYIDYYLDVSIGENDLRDGWPTNSVKEVKTFMEKYAYYFLDFSVQVNCEQFIYCLYLYFENDKEINNIKKQVTIQHQQQEGMENLSHQATTHVLFQQPMQDLCSTYRNSLQVHRPSGLLAGSADSSLHSHTAFQASLQPSAQTLHIQKPLAMQVTLGTEPSHCSSMVCGSGYFTGCHSYAAGCFDG